MSTNSHLSHSTPFKPGLRTGTSKTLATEERSYIRIPKIDDDFINTHFTSLTSLSEIVTKIKMDSFIKTSLLELEKGSNEDKLYAPLAVVFNKVASSVCGPEPMVFHPSYDIRPSGESRREDRLLAPDFSILPPKLTFTYKDKEGKQRIPWSALESVIEVKRGKRWDHPQAIDYIETLLQYRPDKVYTFGMSCNQELYQFYYADACIQKSSPVFRWKDSLDEFIQFVYTLYFNYENDIGRDKSYTLHGVMWQQQPKAVNASARWRVSFDGRTNEVQRIFARKGKGRRTWLGIGQEINEFSTVTNTPEKDRIRIVKDMWRDTSRRFKESEILNHIHKDGYIAGVVRHISASPVSELTVADPIKGDRMKERVVMASTGLRLSACESVLDFLKVMYDLVETHEQLLVKRGVLHRDISWYNVLCKPEHFIGHDKVIEHPTIGKIL
ncbi:hypothetical protein Clacol_003217 [Clathrus columnatus]|uniref:Fungal-type protein kinase domain-containing protein n=1 Tax=Clathrus columnatus TaxID=1419009 RepID=A0AAV5A7L6_9AGAM|nr:hypothetical protein Clacol_003217 [Clathrus columnatus]